MFNIEELVKNSSKYLNTLNIIFYLMVSIPLLLFCIIYLNFQQQGGLLSTTPEDFRPLLHMVIPVLTAISLIAAFVFYRKQLSRQDFDASLSEKLLLFYYKSINKYILLLIANMLPVIGLYLSGEQMFAAIYTITLIAFSLTRPTLHRIFKDLRLSKDEQHKFIQSQHLNEG